MIADTNTMQCNIDQRGRRVRFIGGVIAIIAAVLALVLVSRGIVAWLLAAALFLVGLFQLYEAKKGWCAVRAMGVRTPW